MTLLAPGNDIHVEVTRSCLTPKTCGITGRGASVGGEMQLGRYCYESWRPGGSGGADYVS